MGKIIDWLWENTVSQEAQELVHADYLAITHEIETNHWSKCTEALGKTEDEDWQQRLADAASESYDASTSAAKELLGLGWSYDGADWVREVVVEDDESSEDDDEIEEPGGFLGSLGRLFFG